MELAVGNNHQFLLVCVVLNRCQKLVEQSLRKCRIGQLGVDLGAVFCRIGLNCCSLKGADMHEPPIS